MRQFTWTALAIVCLAAICQSTPLREKRQVSLDASGAINPAEQEIDIEDGNRDKRKVEHGIEASYGVKNALLGLVFNKINSFIDQKTHWIAELDKQNIAKNKAAGIEVPKDPVLSLSGLISSVIGSKLQAAGPLISIVTSKIGSGSAGLFGGSSGGGGGGATGHASGGLNLGGLLGGFGGGAGASAGGGDYGATATAYGNI